MRDDLVGGRVGERRAARIGQLLRNVEQRLLLVIEMARARPGCARCASPGASARTRSRPPRPAWREVRITVSTVSNSFFDSDARHVDRRGLQEARRGRGARSSRRTVSSSLFHPELQRLREFLRAAEQRNDLLRRILAAAPGASATSSSAASRSLIGLLVLLEKARRGRESRRGLRPRRRGRRNWPASSSSAVQDAVQFRRCRTSCARASAATSRRSSCKLVVADARRRNTGPATSSISCASSKITAS